MLNLRHLRTLQEIAEQGGVGAAADALQLTPSAVSQQMAALHAELGTEVVERVGRGVRLTGAGEVLLAHAEGLLAAESVARTAVLDAIATATVRLRVGLFASVALGLMPALAAEIDASAPHLRLSTREIDLEQARVDVLRNRLDAAFVLDYPEALESWSPGLDLADIGADTFSVALPEHRELPDGPLRLRDLADEHWIMASTATYVGRASRSACRRAGFEPRVSHEVEEQATALALVSAGLGVCLVSDFGRSSPPPGVQVRPLRAPVSRQLLLAYAHTQADRPALHDLIGASRRAMAQVQEAPIVPPSVEAADEG
ncbi:LysR family transcriptional regulator [Nocardioidaceae bacterium]|nr:LysR family transcriptional regulator [Nocardioidaceae bacterium]